MSSGGASSWPPAVREWVSKCLGQMTPSNKEAASAELKQVIATAYSRNELATIDWSKKELESLKSPPPLQLKRKIDPPVVAAPPKKKKANLGGATFPLVTDSRLQERALRFQREHEIERRKQLGTHTSTEPTHSTHVNAPSALGNGLGSVSGPAYNIRRKFLKASASVNDAQAPIYDANVIDWDKYTITGTSTELFKPYLRITSAPDPSKIRPLHVLEKTLKELSRRWREDPDYRWTSDQFKSLRQDLTVQRIKNKFTVQVYEIHARMALESSDLVEYNQCQAMLRDLFALGLVGSHDEFLAYRILYLCYTRDRSELNRLISTLTSKQKQQRFIRHALEVHRALATNNYHTFFILFLNSPNMGAYILDHLVDRERVNALVIMTKAYKQLPMTFIASELQFDSVGDAVTFLHDNGAASFVRVKSSSSSSTANTPPPGSSSASNGRPLLQRVGTLTIGDGLSVPDADEDKVLDCPAAHPPLVQCLATKYSHVGIKGSI